MPSSKIPPVGHSTKPLTKPPSPFAQRRTLSQRQVVRSPTPNRRQMCSGYHSGSDSDSRQTTLHKVHKDQARQIVISLAQKPTTPTMSRRHRTPSPVLDVKGQQGTPVFVRRSIPSSPISGRKQTHIQRQIPSPTPKLTKIPSSPLGLRRVVLKSPPPDQSGGIASSPLMARRMKNSPALHSSAGDSHIAGPSRPMSLIIPKPPMPGDVQPEMDIIAMAYADDDKDDEPLKNSSARDEAPSEQVSASVCE